MAKIINIDAALKSLDTIEVSVYKQYTTLEIMITENSLKL